MQNYRQASGNEFACRSCASCITTETDKLIGLCMQTVTMNAVSLDHTCDLHEHKQLDLFDVGHQSC